MSRTQWPPNLMSSVPQLPWRLTVLAREVAAQLVAGGEADVLVDGEDDEPGKVIIIIIIINIMIIIMIITCPGHTPPPGSGSGLVLTPRTSPGPTEPE